MDTQRDRQLRGRAAMGKGGREATPCCAEMVTTSEGPPTEPWSQSVEHPSEAISVTRSRQGQALRVAQSDHL